MREFKSSDGCRVRRIIVDVVTGVNPETGEDYSPVICHMDDDTDVVNAHAGDGGAAERAVPGDTVGDAFEKLLGEIDRCRPGSGEPRA